MTSGSIAEHAPRTIGGPARAARKRIAVAGCGVVGTAFLQLLEKHGERFPHVIASVLVRDPARGRDCGAAKEVITGVWLQVHTGNKKARRAARRRVLAFV